MLNRFLMQCSKEFRFFLYAMAFVMGLRAVLATEDFDGLAGLWSYLAIAVAVIGTWRHGFWKGQAASGATLLLMSLFDPIHLVPVFLSVFVIGVVLSAGAAGAARAMGKGSSLPAIQKRADDAVVSVVPNGSNADATAAQVLARFGLNEQNAQ